MTSPAQRLHYAFEPGEGGGRGRYRDANSPIRDAGTAGDLAVLQRHLGSAQFDPVIGATLGHFESYLEHHGGGSGEEPWCHLSRQGLGEPSSIAHSAMLLLALAAWQHHPSEERRRRVMAELAAGILRQQRADGSLRVYFDPPTSSDGGWQLYGGEAAFALATAFQPLGDERLLGAASRALEAYRHKQGAVDPDELCFFANWELQAAAAVHRATADAALRRWLAGYMRELQQDVVQSGFFGDVAAAPHRQATVEVACALEGLAHCLRASLAQAAADAAAGEGGEAAAEQDRKRHELWAECARVAVEFLLAAQVEAGPGVPQGAVGGFGHTQRPGSGQRVDVTGHVCSAFLVLLEMLAEQEGRAGREP